MDLSIVIVNWNTRELLAQCLESIYANPPGREFEIWVVDNASSDGSAAMVRERFPQVRMIENRENAGFARANNQAAAIAKSRYLLFLNPDTLIHQGALNSLLRHLETHPGVGAVGPRLLNLDGSLQVSVHPAPTLFRELWRLFHLDRLFPVSQYDPSIMISMRPAPVDALMGACILVRRKLLEEVGLFDEGYFVYSEEVDLCERIRRAGWEIHWVPEAIVTHVGGQSTRQMADEMFLELYRNKVLFFRKHRGRFQANLYKIVLFLAALTRFLLGQVFRSVLFSRRDEWLGKAAQYRLLIAVLPSL